MYCNLIANDRTYLIKPDSLHSKLKMIILKLVILLCMYVCVCVCVSVCCWCVCVCMYTHAHTHTLTNTNTHSHACTHTQTHAHVDTHNKIFQAMIILSVCCNNCSTSFLVIAQPWCMYCLFCQYPLYNMLIAKYYIIFL